MTDRELARMAEEFRDGILDCVRFGNDSSGMCFAVSSALGGYLSAMGMECRLVERDFGFSNHVWLELPDGRILDATADQWNKRVRKPFPKVYVGPVPSIYKRWIAAAGAHHDR